MKKTVVLGASDNPIRYAYSAVHQLLSRGYEVVPIGNRSGEVLGIPIEQGKPELSDVHTITLYLNPRNQKGYYDYILGLKPQRIIFNPGTENAELAMLARQRGIEVEMACTLVMLTLGAY
ncbi:MAG: CoA-binding protein [Phaeodactylibacter sp.]|nr:CoA-binding protein [Phaeodactylibacter sp.]MCB9301541.1 CoA-binding protein [Lewinellaceae bacterium]HQU60110.1 CoA-binding protein [Saprospiraceae bacterium]